MAKRKIDYNRIKKEFLSDQTTSLKDMAVKHGISYGYLRKISMRQGWVAEKKFFWEEVDMAVVEKVGHLIGERCEETVRQFWIKRAKEKNQRTFLIQKGHKNSETSRLFDELNRICYN